MTLAHIGEPVEEHTETAVPQPVQRPTDIGFYFFGGVVALALIGFLAWKFLKTKK